MSFSAIILAAGKSRRMNINKLSFMLGENFLVNHSLLTFAEIEEIEKIYLVTDDKTIKENLSVNENKVVFIKGGLSRSQSVYNALKECDTRFALIHDGARPFVTKKLIKRVMDCCSQNNSAVPVLPLPDSIRHIDKSGKITAAVDRDNYRLAQTPQGFNTKMLLDAYERCNTLNYTDDSEIFSKYYGQAFTVEGEHGNRKITYDNDLFGINARVGIGYDLHTLKEGLPFTLGGVKIPHYKGFVAYSDGDALIHSIMDALLSMAGKRDIGTFFPDTRNEYKDISSVILLKEVARILKEEGIKINNISSVIVAQKPKLQQYIPQMITVIAQTLGIDTSKIAVHATTNEGCGETGQEQAVAVYTVCSGF